MSHPPQGGSSFSIAAVVASMDLPNVTKYRDLVCHQPPNQELLRDPSFGGMIKEHLLAFPRSTNQRPKRIIFYRDGVGEGQFNQVLLNETVAIREACGSLWDDYLPPVTFVVVQKRHHTRFFPVPDSKQENKSENILPVPPAYYTHLLAYRARHHIKEDIGSVRGTHEQNDADVKRPSLAHIKENIKDVMFYC